MTVPDLTLAKVLERLLSHCDNRVFEVAKWLNDHAERGKIIILGDGEPMHPNAIPDMLKVVGLIPSEGKPYLIVQPQRALTINSKVWTIEREGFETHCPGKVEPKKLTLKQEMILAIVRRLWLNRRRSIPTNVAHVTREIEKQWQDEYGRRKLHDPKLEDPPDRKTVRRTLQEASLI